MEAISFKLDAFEGPLDLLLHLVSKHKLNIYDIEISLLLEQYLLYIEGMETRDYEQAADFLEMAARLIYIKTCYLLPQPEEAEELKKTLQGRMIEYSLCKWAAQRLREDYAGGTVFVRAPVKLPVNKQYTRLHDRQELYDAYLMISAKVKEYKPLRANLFSPIVSKRIVSVESKIAAILERLYSCGSFEMSRLYDGMKERSERIAAFLAVLELTKMGRISLNEDNTLIELRREQTLGDADNTEPVGNTDIPESADVQEYTDELENMDEPESTDEQEHTDILESADEQAYTDIPDNTDVTENTDTENNTDITEPDADETAEESDSAGAAEEEPPVTEDKPARSYSVQLAQSVHTATLRVDEPRPTPEEVGEFVSLFDEPEAIAVFAPIAFPEPPEQTADVGAEEPYVSAFKPNYYARRYYWGCAPLADGRRSYRAAWNMRI